MMESPPRAKKVVVRLQACHAQGPRPHLGEAALRCVPWGDMGLAVGRPRLGPLGIWRCRVCHCG
ncbi:hypothetical protein JOF35_005235 [Streptomyces demainii]|uniref:Uncharacterized protein n=1 Tax=Streptomyces demainii TaxID=588122 RepID=A0ABT9KWZ0_9ACTN|nr:hypothetical protein [Streptomyces demainii]